MIPDDPTVGICLSWKNRRVISEIGARRGVHTLRVSELKHFHAKYSAKEAVKTGSAAKVSAIVYVKTEYFDHRGFIYPKRSLYKSEKNGTS